jgi:ankyrin repeat protein
MRPDPVGWLAAAKNGRPASVQRLLDHGADPNLTDDRGRTPLQLSQAGQLNYPTNPGHAQVHAILAPHSTGSGPTLN